MNSLIKMNYVNNVKNNLNLLYLLETEYDDENWFFNFYKNL